VTADELRTHVFNALADYRDRMSDDERMRLGGFFVGRDGEQTLIFGGPPTPTFAVSVSLASGNVDPDPE
jgi:hypothetical protein